MRFVSFTLAQAGSYQQERQVSIRPDHVVGVRQINKTTSKVCTLGGFRWTVMGTRVEVLDRLRKEHLHDDGD
jgi:hypothetical protein